MLQIPRSAESLKKVHNALDIFEEYYRRVGKKYVVADYVTIADFAFISSFMCLEGIEFSFENHPLAKTWYETFKRENQETWKVVDSALKEIQHIENNPPDLSELNHPFLPVRKQK
jgi:glutathione S-transferase